MQIILVTGIYSPPLNNTSTLLCIAVLRADPPLERLEPSHLWAVQS